MSPRVLTLPLALLVLALGSVSAEAGSRVSGDFNGDGHDDLAIGVPNESIGSAPAAGAVNVIYGAEPGLTAEADQFLRGWSAETGFGSSLAVGDFNGNGFDDLAVGVGWDDVGSAQHAGLVYVAYGGPAGLREDAQVWHQDSAGVADAAEAFDQFGATLTAGDFNGSGHDDLAVGVPGEGFGSTKLGAGAVNVIYGSSHRLSATGNQFWRQNGNQIPDSAEEFDRFGSSLAAGDFDGSGQDDLAIGVPGESVAGSFEDAGAVNVILGGALGLSAQGTQWLHQDSAGIADAAEEFDRFGSSLAAGDFDGSGQDDLAVGVPRESVGAAGNAGAVNVIYGSAARLTATGNLLWHQDSIGIAEEAETDDRFGYSLAAGDFNAGGHDDLAVGVLGESVRAIRRAGAVNVIYGAQVGLRARGNELRHQNSTGIAESAETDDEFGVSLTAGDFDGSGHDDLAVGVVGESIDPLFPDAGAVNVIYGSAARLTATGNQLWHQNSSGIEGAIQEFDAFGSSLPT